MLTVEISTNSRKVVYPFLSGEPPSFFTNSSDTEPIKVTSFLLRIN